MNDKLFHSLALNALCLFDFVFFAKEFYLLLLRNFPACSSQNIFHKVIILFDDEIALEVLLRQKSANKGDSDG